MSKVSDARDAAQANSEALSQANARLAGAGWGDSLWAATIVRDRARTVWAASVVEWTRVTNVAEAGELPVATVDSAEWYERGL